MFGSALAVVGDVDGDGFGDLLVGDSCDPTQMMSNEPRCQPTAPGEAGPSGRIHLYFGRDNWAATDLQRVTVEGETSGRLGRAAAPAGDLNGDGYADFVVSGTTSPEEHTSGVVNIYLGRPRAQWMQTVTPYRRLNGAPNNLLLGASVAALDVNRDGRTDILAGAPGRGMDLETYPGSVLVWLANSSGDYGPVQALLPAGPSGGFFGEVVASVGDVDGDGWGDLVVTAPLNPLRSFQRGEAYLWTYATTPFPGAPQTLSAQAGARWLGRSIAN